MSTKAAVLAEAKWYTEDGGYHEKANGDARYLTDTKDNFLTNAGSANWTWFGQLCGINPGAWCAMFVSGCVYKACGKDKEKAKVAMWGVWPYSACDQLWNAADNDHRFWSHYQRWVLGKGDRKEYTPCVGDVVIFSDNGVTRDHTGLVYAVDDKYIYTREGNSSNMARERSYQITSTYIYGYVKLNLPDGELIPEDGNKYGPKCCDDPELYELSKGCAGTEVERWQAILRGLEITDDGGNLIDVDGEFGPKTEEATKRLQMRLFPDELAEWDGIVGARTWNAAFNTKTKRK